MILWRQCHSYNSFLFSLCHNRWQVRTMLLTTNHHKTDKSHMLLLFFLHVCTVVFTDSVSTSLHSVYCESKVKFIVQNTDKTQLRVNVWVNLTDCRYHDDSVMEYSLGHALLKSDVLTRVFNWKSSFGVSSVSVWVSGFGFGRAAVSKKETSSPKICFVKIVPCVSDSVFWQIHQLELS